MDSYDIIYAAASVFWWSHDYDQQACDSVVCRVRVASSSVARACHFIVARSFVLYSIIAAMKMHNTRYSDNLLTPPVITKFGRR